MIASYRVSLLIAKKGAFSIGEELIKPAAIEMIRIVCGKKEASKLNMVPLSNDTIQRRIVEMSIDINEQLIDRIKNSGQFSMQLDETTDIIGEHT